MILSCCSQRRRRANDSRFSLFISPGPPHQPAGADTLFLTRAAVGVCPKLLWERSFIKKPLCSWHGSAWPGWAGHGRAWRGAARLGKARQGNGQGEIPAIIFTTLCSWHGAAGQGKARQGRAWHGTAGRGVAGRGMAWLGMARQGKGPRKGALC